MRNKKIEIVNVNQFINLLKFIIYGLSKKNRI